MTARKDGTARALKKEPKTGATAMSILGRPLGQEVQPPKPPKIFPNLSRMTRTGRERFLSSPKGKEYLKHVENETERRKHEFVHRTAELQPYDFPDTANYR